LTKRSYDGVVGNEVESFAYCIGRGVDVNYMNLGGANARRLYHIALKVTVDIPREHAILHSAIGTSRRLLPVTQQEHHSIRFHARRTTEPVDHKICQVNNGKEHLPDRVP
jgi:hypothetical protein